MSDIILFGGRCQIIKKGGNLKMGSKKWGILIPLMLARENGG